MQAIPPSEEIQRNNPFAKRETSSEVLAGTSQGSGNVTQQDKTPGGNQTLVIILSALCLLFLASTAWLFFTNPPVKLKPSGTLNPAPAVISANQSMESVMKIFDETGAWNLPVADNGIYIGFVSKSSIFSSYRSKIKDITIE